MKAEERHDENVQTSKDLPMVQEVKARTQNLPEQAQTSRQAEKQPAGRISLNWKDLHNNLAIMREVNECSSKVLEEEKDLLNSFKFPVMRDREDNIPEAERATFEWVFEQSNSTDSRWHNFRQWFTGEGSLYWFSGKAGSGKSTLMKHVFSHAQTASLINTWAQDIPSLMAGFFFWNAGGSMQKSQAGLLKSLIYQFLASHRELMPVIAEFTKSRGHHGTGHTWSKPILEGMLERMVSQRLVPLKICLFIDGLDEYHGDYGDLTNFLVQLSKNDNIKICVSSRPYSLFDTTFGGLPRLKLEELTHNDILTYSFTKFSNNFRVCELQRDDPDLARRLATAITNKASGVFLWVKLVVRSLCEGLDKFDRISDLENRLRELPKDLLELYMHMLKSVEKRYVTQASKLLQIVHRATKPLTLLQLAFADMEDEELDVAWKSGLNHYGDKELDKICSSAEGRLRSRCLGLIEVSPMHLSPNSDAKSRAVDFMHKTVVDFLEDNQTKTYLVESEGGHQFNPYPCLMKAGILDMKHSEIFHDRQPAMVLAQNWFQFSWASIKAITSYAAVQEAKKKESQISVIDELDRVATKLLQLYSCALV
ncbi:hypothetical protein COL940_009008 [Colletotrichum noveboracense]|nr:hypothetical protein COL940_009008 [Colletotrichum noveboracense]